MRTSRCGSRAARRTWRMRPSPDARHRRSGPMTSARHLREHGPRELVEGEWLHYARASALLDELLGGAALNVAGEENDARRMCRIALEQITVDRVATRIGHPQVEEQHVVPATRDERVRFRTGRCRIDRVSETNEIPHDRRADRRLVVHDED